MKSDVLGEQPFLSQKKLLSIINFQKTVRTIELPKSHKTSAQVKKCFFTFLSRQFFNFDKLKQYVPQFI